MLLAGSGMVEYSRMTPEVRDQLQQVIDEVEPMFDHVLLDTGAGISDVVLYTVSLAGEVLVVVTPEPTSLTDAYATIKVLVAAQGRRRVSLVVNQTRRPARAARGAAAAAAGGGPLRQPWPDSPVRLELLGEVPPNRRFAKRCSAASCCSRLRCPASPAAAGACAGRWPPTAMQERH